MCKTALCHHLGANCIWKLGGSGGLGKLGKGELILAVEGGEKDMEHGRNWKSCCGRDATNGSLGKLGIVVGQPRLGI